MKSIGLFTCHEEPNFWDDDVLLYNDLMNAGHNVKPVIWDDHNINYELYDYFIFRSVWDYHHRYKEFASWLSGLEKAGVTTHNSVKAIKYNIDKAYLLEFQSKGINIIPTIMDVTQNISDLKKYYKYFDTDDIIIKPTVGASSYQILKINLNESDRRLNEIKNIITDKVLIQRFVPEVYSYGEISMVYINKTFSHSVVKKAKDGDFRVQDDYGGTFNYFTPSKHLLAKADEVIDKIEYDLLYARVDCLYYDNIFYLMELELIEPILYLHDKKFRDTFVKAISKL